MLQPTNVFSLAVLNAITAAAGLLDDAEVGLFTDGGPAGGLATLADLTEADYTGYARQTITDVQWGAAYLAAGAIPAVRGPALDFVPTGTAITNVIIGWFLADSTGLILYWVEMLDEPVSLGSPFTVLSFRPGIQLPPDGIYGNVTEEN